MKTANSKVIDCMFAHMGKGDLDAAARLLDPEIVIHEAESLPYGGTYHGMEGFFDLFRKLAQEFDKLSITPSIIEDTGPFVVALTTLNGQQRCTGKAIVMPLFEQFKLKNKLVVEVRPFYWDTAQIMSSNLL